MTRIISTITAILLCSILFGAQTLQKSKQNGAKISFEQSAFDFGKIKESGATVVHSFEFVNNGTAPLVIIRAETSCTCTKTEFSKKPIAVGERSSIKVSYNPKKQSGVFYKAIQIYTNSSEKRTIITVKGEVIN